MSQMTSQQAEPLFSLRDATDDDLPIVNRYAYWEGMDNMPSAEGIRVAVEPGGAIVGFCRVARGVDGKDYVRPMVTYHTWRRHGVGRALIEDALARSNGELLLVARGGAVPFYRACGFTEATWDDLEEDVASDCSQCEMRDECNPQPMRRIRQDSLK